MSGGKESREQIRRLLREGEGLTVEQRRHLVVRDARGMVVTTIPTSPGTQSSMQQTRRDVDRILSGQPARRADHVGLHGTRRVTEEPRRPAPARERPLKERFEPESVDVGPLGYTAEEIFARMPPPARPAEQEVEEEEEPDWDKDPEVITGLIRRLFPQCDRCRESAELDDTVMVTYDMSEQEFIKSLVRLELPRPQAAWLAKHRAMGEQYLLTLCQPCLRAIGLATGEAADDFVTCQDLAEAIADEAVNGTILDESEIAIPGKALLKVGGMLPRAFRDPVKMELITGMIVRPVMPVITWSVLPGSPDWNQMAEIAREAGLRELPPPRPRRGKRDPRPRRPHSSGLSDLSAAEKPVTVLGVEIDPGQRRKATLDELPRKVELPDHLVAKPPALVGSHWVLEGPAGLTA